MWHKQIGVSATLAHFFLLTNCQDRAYYNNSVVLVFLLEIYFIDPPRKFNGTRYPWFLKIFFRSFGLRKCLMTFLGNESGSVNFLQYLRTDFDKI